MCKFFFCYFIIIIKIVFINRALAHGISHLVGSIEVGKVADLVAFRPSFFGSKPELILKGGIIVWGQMGKSYIIKIIENYKNT